MSGTSEADTGQPGSARTPETKNEMYNDPSKDSTSSEIHTYRKPNKKECVRTVFMAARENSVPYLKAILKLDKKIKFKDHRYRTRKEQTSVLQGALIMMQSVKMMLSMELSRLTLQVISTQCRAK